MTPVPAQTYTLHCPTMENTQNLPAKLACTLEYHLAVPEKMLDMAPQVLTVLQKGKLFEFSEYACVNFPTRLHTYVLTSAITTLLASSVNNACIDGERSCFQRMTFWRSSHHKYGERWCVTSTRTRS